MRLTGARSTDEIRDLIRQRLKAHGGSQVAFAKGVLGISPAYLSDILAGQRDPSDRIAEKLGFTRLTVYVPQGGDDA